MIKRFSEEPDIAFRSYGLDLDHKHLPEMKKHAGLKHAPVFSPSVVPAFRGMIVDIPIPLNVIGTKFGPTALWNTLDYWYDCPGVVRLKDMGENPKELILRDDVEPWDGMDLYVCGDAEAEDSSETEQVRLIAHLDNLGKGASGAAIQNLNIMCGLPETTGLRL